MLLCPQGKKDSKGQRVDVVSNFKHYGTEVRQVCHACVLGNTPIAALSLWARHGFCLSICCLAFQHLQGRLAGLLRADMHKHPFREQSLEEVRCRG